jgi:glycosyltransferase involved in cell wall biosynthesis
VDVLVVESPPLFLGLAGYVISRCKGAPYVFNVADLWPETAVALGALKNRVLIRLAEGLEWLLYRQAIRVTTVTRGIRRILLERGMAADRVLLFTNGVDIQYFHPQADPYPANRRFHLDNRLTVAYAGTHGMAQGLEVLVQAAELLRDRDDIHFIMVGEGAEKPELMALANEYALANLTFHPNQPKSFMPHLWAAVDIAVVTLRKLDIFRSALPSKLFEMMAMECPIILSAEGEACELIAEAQAGLTIAPENSGALAEAIVRLAEDEDLRHLFGKNGRAYVQQNFSRDHLTDRWEAMLDSVRKSKS